MKKTIMMLSICFVLINLNFISSAHYIVGYVENAKDGESANGKTIMLWNYSDGAEENITDIVGAGGNSGVNNIYMIDCEMLPVPCDGGNILSLKIVDDGSGYVSEIKNVTVSWAGYTIVGNITLNSIPQIAFVEIDDEFIPPIYPEKEIDLNAGGVREILCKAKVTEYDGEKTLKNASSKFFHYSSSYENEDDNNTHYSNNSCSLDESYGSETESEIICSITLQYYTNPEEWNCTIEVYDDVLIFSRGSNTTNVNELIAIYVNSTIDFGQVNGSSISDEQEFTVINYGNTKINLSLSGYSEEEDDGIAMTCFIGEIPIYYEKYNLTESNLGEITLEEFNERYINLSSSQKISEFNLDYRKSETENDAFNKTYWRIYLPNGVAGNCYGNIIFGATKEKAN